MVKRNVIWTKTADIQFLGILEYWKNINKSNKYSIKLIKLVSDRTTQIALNPELFKRTKFNNMHVSSMKNYSIYYSVTEKEIIITAFWDNRQDPNVVKLRLKPLIIN